MFILAVNGTLQLLSSGWPMLFAAGFQKLIFTTAYKVGICFCGLITKHTFWFSTIVGSIAFSYPSLEFPS
jgi:hypothetical protein